MEGGSADGGWRHAHVSTRWEPKRRVGGADPGRGRAARDADPAHEVALVALAKRELLLRVHRHRLRREDLEDCFSQATLELLAGARNGAFASRVHLARTLEQRFLSRVNDRRRALSGRSPMQAALETATSLDGSGPEAGAIADPRGDPERIAILREELARVHAFARRLTPDQRLVIAAQVSLSIGTREFCAIHGWSQEKYRKVAQRGRARLRLLMIDEDAVPPPRRLSEKVAGTGLLIAGLRLDTSHAGTDVGPNRSQDGPRWRILDRIPTWARWSVRHPPGL